LVPEQVEKLWSASASLPGWFRKEAAYLLALLDYAHEREEIQGDLFEIGVFHGKSTLLLGGMVDPERETLGVCDPFQFRTAGGVAPREIFLKNFHEVFPDAEFLRVYPKRSQELTQDEIGTCRLIHIDGAHSFDAVSADLQLASDCLDPRGVIVLDDAFRGTWPGVTEAIIRFLDTDSGFSPLIIGFGKMALVPTRARGLYEPLFTSPDIYKRYWGSESVRLRTDSICGLSTYVIAEKKESDRGLWGWIKNRDRAIIRRLRLG
jgi:hypothetical protein